MEIWREFTFEAAHLLPNVPDGHKCRRLHGHSYRVEIRVTGRVDEEAGWVMDFGEIKAAWAPLDDLLDHRYLNEVAGLDNPTSENVARWIWDRLAAALPLSAVTVRETCTSGCTYRAAGVIFYLGAHQPHWLESAGFPLFVSHRRLRERRSLPRAIAPWALDSGGFTALSGDGTWDMTPGQYVAAVERYAAEIGRLEWAAPMDWMCEPGRSCRDREDRRRASGAHR